MRQTHPRLGDDLECPEEGRAYLTDINISPIGDLRDRRVGLRG